MDETYLLIAEAQAQSEIDAGVRRAIAKLPKQPKNFDGLCVDCDEEIPSQRLSFGAITCIQCQTVRERFEAMMKQT